MKRGQRESASRGEERKRKKIAKGEEKA